MITSSTAMKGKRDFPTRIQIKNIDDRMQVTMPNRVAAGNQSAAQIFSIQLKRAVIASQRVLYSRCKVIFYRSYHMPSVNLKSLSVPQLLGMRSDIDAMLQSRRSELQAQLAEIGGATTTTSTSRVSRIKGSKVAAKYRNPKTGETWSGRGGVAGWLAAEIKAGKKREDFLIAGNAKPANAKVAKKRKAKAK